MAGFITAEGVGLPVPGEVVLVTAAALAARGELSLTAVVIGAWAGTVLGGTGGYWIGRTGGNAVLSRFGHYVGVTPERQKRAEAFFDRNGAKTIIIARFIAILRMVAGVLAGVSLMPFALFEACNAIGGALWVATFSALGYVFGKNLPLLEHYLRRTSLIALAIVIVIGALVWARQRRSAPRNAQSRNDR